MSNRILIGGITGLRTSPLRMLPPVFLAPSLVTSSGAPFPLSQFSTTTPIHHRRRKGNNSDRGVSALRRTGLRFPVGMSKYPLPQPVLDPKKRSKIEVDENHGLWGFFNKDRTLLTDPNEEDKFGRAWTFRELRNKSWEDIHALWWICCKERNRLATEKAERARLKAGAGDAEAKARDKEIRATQKAIKTALTERWYTWEDARKVAEKDPEVDLNSDLDAPAYTPRKKAIAPIRREVPDDYAPFSTKIGKSMRKAITSVWRKRL